MAENLYLNNRLKYHTASRVAISTGQSMMQATNGDGHTVTAAQVWTSANSEFPKNTSAYAESSNVVGATQDLITVFKNGNEYAVQGVPANLAGKVFRNDDFPAVELYDGVEMTDVEYSDKQAWEIKNGNERVMDWCAPTAVKNGVLPVPGYTGYAQASADGSKWVILQDSPNKSYGWSLAGGNWQFVYMSGMLTFHPDYIPSAMSYSKIRFTGFKYIGSYLANVNENIQSEVNKGIAIKPYKFNLSTMEAEVVDQELGLNNYSIEVPGFVFEVAQDNVGSLTVDVEHTASGNSTIKFTEIIEANLGENKDFTAYAFVQKNGGLITVLQNQVISK